jgi:hypothetical protein
MTDGDLVELEQLARAILERVQAMRASMRAAEVTQSAGYPASRPLSRLK